MSVKSGEILHSIHGFVIDRIQTAGIGNLNIPEEKVYELGNYQTVATVRDIPDISFDMESFDVSTEIEAILTNQDPTATVDGDAFDFGDAVPLNVISPFKAGGTSYAIVRGIAVPHLTLERVTYRFGLRQNSTQSFTLRGDSVYYIPGSPRQQSYTNIGTGTYNFSDTAIVFQENGNNIYALSVCLYDSTTNAYKRLFFGDDYTNTSAGFTLLADLSADYDTIRVVYGTATADTFAQTVHQTTSVKPAAVRGKDIDVYLGTSDATPAFTRWRGVQSVEVTRSVNIENDEEFGNEHFVDSGYDTADVTGSITMKPVDAEALWTKIAEVADVASNEIVGPQTSVFLPMEIRISDPDTGVVLKTLYVPDARFQVPGVQGRVQTKLETTFNFTSDGGSLTVYSGER